MVVRLFLILFVLNAVAFVVRADAAEKWPFDPRGNSSLSSLQEAMSGDFDRNDRDSMTELGAHLLQWPFAGSGDGKRYASDPMQASHGIALLNEGACLNLKWNF